MCQSIAKNRRGVLLTLLLSLAMLGACQLESSSEEVAAVNAQIFIFPGETEKRLISREEIVLNNCAGRAETSQWLTRSHTVHYTMEVGRDLAINAEGVVALQNIGLVNVGSEVASYYQVDYGRQEIVSRSVTVAAAPNSHIQHTIYQFEVWETGEILVVSDNQSQRLPYSIRRDFSIEAVAPVNIGCEVIVPTPMPDLPIEPYPTVQVLEDGTIIKQTNLHVGETHIGRIELSAPEKITISDSGIIRLTVTLERGLDNLTRIPVDSSLLNNPDSYSYSEYVLQLPDGILMYPIMQASLTAGNFATTPSTHSANEKFMNPGLPVTWSWLIKPENEGQQSLILDISTVLVVDGRVSYHTVSDLPLSVLVLSVLSNAETDLAPEATVVPESPAASIAGEVSSPSPIDRFFDPILESATALLVAFIALIGTLITAYATYQAAKKKSQ